MKSIITSAILAAMCNVCGATDFAPLAVGSHFEMERMPFGSGTPSTASTTGMETAHHVVDGLYHVPNYLPGFPTAATIWPRELPIECESETATGDPACTGYRVLPAVGRGEYIFIRPVAKVAPPPPPPPVPQPVEETPPPPKAMPVARKKPLG